MTRSLTDEQVLKMGKLAILASSPMGLGYLHFDPDLQESQIDDLTVDEQGLFIDYYQGRMVKFYARRQPDGWQFRDTISPEYQSWSGTYPSYEALAEAVMKEPVL